MNNKVRFIIAALVIIAGAMAFQNYKNGGFDNAQNTTAPVETDTASH